MHFQDMPYRRITFEEMERRYRELIQDFQAAPDAAACMDVLRRRDQLNADSTPIYQQPDMSPEARNQLWRRLEGEYVPCDDYSGNPNLEQGCGWQRIPHVFQWPFYAIDYALAQVCALQYCQWMHADFSAAWQSYLGFCRSTGSLSFPELVREAGLKDPFAEDTLPDLVGWLRRFL